MKAHIQGFNVSKGSFVDKRYSISSTYKITLKRKVKLNIKIKPEMFTLGNPSTKSARLRDYRLHLERAQFIGKDPYWHYFKIFFSTLEIIPGILWLKFWTIGLDL